MLFNTLCNSRCFIFRTLFCWTLCASMKLLYLKVLYKRLKMTISTKWQFVGFVFCFFCFLFPIRNMSLICSHFTVVIRNLKWSDMEWPVCLWPFVDWPLKKEVWIILNILRLCKLCAYVTWLSKNSRLKGIVGAQWSHTTSLLKSSLYHISAPPLPPPLHPPSSEFYHAQKELLNHLPSSPPQSVL